jgi:AbrB family looped-hinge helix DNA binding protein
VSDTWRITVRDKGQMTLPAPIIERLGLEPGSLLSIQYDPAADVLVLRPLAVIRRPAP